MAKNKVEQVIETPVVEVSNSKGGMLTKLGVVGLGIAAAIGGTLFIKNKRKHATDEVKTSTDQNDKENN